MSNSIVPHARKDISGKKFNQLLVQSLSHQCARRKSYWHCLCDCGNYTVVQGHKITSGKTKSCGCHRKKVLNRRTHGYSKSKTYRVWNQMKQRCQNPNNEKYFRYGERGITVCERWQIFQNFLDDIGVIPDGMTIDRIYNDKGYSPGNVRIATQRMQAGNRSTTKLITHNGKTLSMSEWSRQLGGNNHLVMCRIIRGWSKERAVTTPVR